MSSNFVYLNNNGVLEVVNNLTIGGSLTVTNDLTLTNSNIKYNNKIFKLPTKSATGPFTLATISDITTPDLTTVSNFGTASTSDVTLGHTGKITTINGSTIRMGTITTGTWSGGTIAVDKGGTGYSSYTNGQLLIGNSTGNTLTRATLTPGSNITITPGAGSIEIASTTYTAGTNITLNNNSFDLNSTLTGQLTFDNIPTVNNKTLITDNSTATLTNKKFADLTLFKEGIEIKQTATSGGIGAPNSAYVKMWDKDNDKYILLCAPEILASNFDIILPTPTTTTTLLGDSSTQNVSGKTFIDHTLFNRSLQVKNGHGGETNVSGSVRFYEKADNTGTGRPYYTDLHTGGSSHTLSANRNVYLPDATGTLAIDDAAHTSKWTDSSNRYTPSNTTLKSIDLPVDTELRNATSPARDFITFKNNYLYSNYASIQVKEGSKIVNYSKPNDDWIQYNDAELKVNYETLNHTGVYLDAKIIQCAKNKSGGYIEHYYHASSDASGMYFEITGATRLYYNGTIVTTAGNWADISDSRVKLNQQLADNNKLAKAFDNIDLYTYKYTEQYAIENGKSSTDIVYGFIAQNVIEETKTISTQFGKVCSNSQTFPNGKIEYSGEKQIINDLNTINKKDLTILLWAKVKEQQLQIDELKKINQDFENKYRCIPNFDLNNLTQQYGYIVCSTGKYKTYNNNTNTLHNDINAITLDNSLPIVELSNKKKQKNVFGVISNKTPYTSLNDEKRLYINSQNTGAIWIVNTNGNLENGDYIQTSDILGHGEKQINECLTNYTVAKITSDCDFNINSTEYKCYEFTDKITGNKVRKAFVGCIYHTF